ncbi:MAG TPA: hypothetical protein VN048_17775 [Verrucomicrobiae bacterium]|nr:hypothetical protein [Verrucomicrobiae bacterium]
MKLRRVWFRSELAAPTFSKTRLRLAGKELKLLCFNWRTTVRIFKFAMMMNRIGFQMLVAAAALSCYARSNDVEQAILSFPNISAWEYRPDEAVRSANTLISAGQNLACAALEKVAKTGRGSPNICHLCRLVFIPKSSTEILRAPMLGAPELLPLNSMKDSDWPHMPFAIVDDVPLSMTLGYSLGGRAERPEDYLAYCLSNGVFRTKPFAGPTSNTASNALNKILKSPAWKALKWKDSGVGWSYTLSEDYAREMLWKQVKNMVNRPPQ